MSLHTTRNTVRLSTEHAFGETRSGRLFRFEVEVRAKKAPITVARLDITLRLSSRLPLNREIQRWTFGWYNLKAEALVVVKNGLGEFVPYSENTHLHHVRDAIAR